MLDVMCMLDQGHAKMDGNGDRDRIGKVKGERYEKNDGRLETRQGQTGQNANQNKPAGETKDQDTVRNGARNREEDPSKRPSLCFLNSYCIHGPRPHHHQLPPPIHVHIPVHAHG